MDRKRRDQRAHEPTALQLEAVGDAARFRTLSLALVITTVSVTTRLDGSELRIPVHEVKGERDGPTLTLVSTQHGAEWFSIEIVRRVVSELAPSALRGRVIGIPVANPIALEHFTRMTPDESDEPDLNRVWPGGMTWITEQIAAALDKEVLASTDYLMDFHPGPWGAALATIGYGADLPDEKVRRESLEMAHRVRPPVGPRAEDDGSVPRPAIDRGLRGVGQEDPEHRAVSWRPRLRVRTSNASGSSSQVRGVQNVMRHLGMLDGEPDGAAL